jgi:hypothetical protein
LARTASAGPAATLSLTLVQDAAVKGDAANDTGQGDNQQHAHGE